jgi:hypothetical protein
MIKSKSFNFPSRIDSSGDQLLYSVSEQPDPLYQIRASISISIFRGVCSGFKTKVKNDGQQSSILSARRLILLEVAVGQTAGSEAAISATIPGCVSEMVRTGFFSKDE